VSEEGIEARIASLVERKRGVLGSVRWHDRRGGVRGKTSFLEASNYW